MTRVERFVRVLEDHLQIAPESEQLTRLEGCEVDASEQDPTLGRSLESCDEAARRCLPATALPDQPEDLTSLQAEIDSVHRFHIYDVPPEGSEESGFQFEVLAQALDPDDLAVLSDRESGRPDAGGRRV